MQSQRARPRWIVLVLAPLLTGCATIVTGTRETIQIETVPPGATVKLMPGFHEVQTPASIDLKRGDAPYTITAELEGYETQRSYIRGRANAWIWGNILLGGVPGIMIDWVTGSLVDLDPDRIQLTLEKSPEDEEE